MEWLNFHHLHYFWVVAREGGIREASRQLHLTEPTISTQIKQLEKSLGEKLFARAGRRLQLTDVGRVVFSYADDMFSMGRELQNVLRGTSRTRPIRFTVGVAEVLPKLIIYRLLEPVFNAIENLELVCREDKLDRLVADLALHSLDVVLGDAPPSSDIGVRVFSHLLGECGLVFFAPEASAARYRKTFPHSLHDAPFLMPVRNTTLGRQLDQWFRSHEIVPRIRGEFSDSALLKVFAQSGRGLCAGPEVIQSEIERQYHVKSIGHTSEIRERFYAITVERRLMHPAVAALVNSARNRMFGDSG